MSKQSSWVRWAPIHLDTKAKRLEVRIDLVALAFAIAVSIVEVWRRYV